MRLDHHRRGLERLYWTRSAVLVQGRDTAAGHHLDDRASKVMPVSYCAYQFLRSGLATQEVALATRGGDPGPHGSAGSRPDRRPHHFVVDGNQCSDRCPIGARSGTDHRGTSRWTARA